MNIFEDYRVFANFADISKIPRESGSEKAVSDFTADWARALGLDVLQDELYNLIIKKPASPGYESHDAVILQAHLDMVCEKTAGSLHDFEKDPIHLLTNGDFLSAEDTTLGADNGIGVAAAMSILEDDSLMHPPLEVIFTVCEETDFSGAAGLDKSGLKATRMINLDHASETEIIVGSCGGTGVEFEFPITRAPEAPPGYAPYRLTVSGLIGGHSGEDIHRGRGNAIMLAMRIAEMSGLPIVSIDGGTSRLAIPRDASVVILSDKNDLPTRIAEEAESLFRNEYREASELSVRAKPLSTASPAPLDRESFDKLSLTLRAYPDGIVRMFDSMEGIVESSDNIGIIRTNPESILMVSEIRGGYQSTIDDILQSVKRVAGLLDARFEAFASYSPWSAKADSPLADLAVAVYDSLYGRRIDRVAVHAGLECSFFASAMPGLDIISVGPDCENFHSPSERVSISSVLRLQDFLVSLLSEM